MEWCVENGTILKPLKSHFGLTRIKWFRRDFHSNGVSAGPLKIQYIKDGGRPTSIKDVRSLLMANPKFTFDNMLHLTYEKVTAPL